MNKCLSIALAALLVAPLAQAEYATQVPLTLEGEGPWYRLELPLGVQMAASHADLRDLRVLNAEGEELAYALTLGSAQPEEKRQEAAVKWFPLRGAADTQAAPAIRVQRGTSGTLVEVAPDSSASGEQILRGWLLDASAFDQPLHRLQLDWSSDQEGFQRFTIEASDDLQHWQRWEDGQIARLSFADERVEQREVELPGAKARYLRLLWQAPQQAPALLAARVVSIESQDLAPPLAWSAPLASTSSKVGEYSWELPLSLPLERVRVSLPEGNVLAPVSLSSRGAGKLEWQPLTSGLLYRLPQDGKEVLQDEIELWGTPVQQLRLRVDARGGGLDKEAPSLRVAVRGTQVVFLARGSAPYRLVVGDASARSAALPLGTLIPGYEPKRLASLGRAIAPTEVPEIVRDAADAAQSAADWKRVGLWAVLLAGVALLGGMAFSLLRKPGVSEH
ncbi:MULTISPECIES: DUF3999 domain-containing protein [unclassified Pseudomonas]|uniref:DUF3999 domain-containing protein n=1 Tax=unclassified Pseudomonas TaxID=196821 RepID=UPI0024497A84|nr:MULTISPECIES: DUF3999 domain-containing protein [unclassified Pseudomonas]MDG9925948.1 DUF3999 domain-containing protein [Pseudomonas sp. GD04045]MDH0034852.1 DUF3999 domain-containing protein [Pseudomonas sp. GD04019]